MKKIYFRADASAAIGYGHFIRTLALADMLKDDFDCTFFTCHPTPYQVGEMEKVCPFVTLQEETHYDDFLSHLQGDEIVVLDNYFFTADYQRAIKAKGCKLVCVDDMHDKHYVADVVINHALTDQSLFDVEPYTKLCLGFDWALLRRPFLNHTKRECTKGIRQIAICFGGSDYLNLTESFINSLLANTDVSRIVAIVGDSYSASNITASNRVEIKQNLSAQEVANVFLKSDLAILPTSGVCLEAIACGTPVVAGYFVDNQEDIFKEYSKRDYIIPLGDLRNCSIDAINWNNIFAAVSSCSILPTMSSVSSNYIRLFSSHLSADCVDIGDLKFIKYNTLGGR